MSTPLFDRPGPQARRRIFIGSIISGVLIVILAALAIRRFADQGQFEAEKWSPIFNPSDENFEPLWSFLWDGMANTLRAAFWAMLFSLIVGTLFAITRLTATRAYRWLVVTVLELLRGVPVVLAIFFAARALRELGVDLDTLWYLVIGLTAYNSVVIGEIIRAGVQALPKGQTEAAYAIGLRRRATLRLVLLPQAFRIMLPALISQLVVIVKDTSLGSLLPYAEFLRQGNLAVQTLRNPLQMLLVIGAIFVIINYSLSKLAEFVEWRLSAGRRIREVEREVTAVEQKSTAAAGA
jgi:glutamate transport system permease protein